jgi:hypothetical protein
MTPLRRTERSERPVNPVRVVPGTATSRLNSRSAAETPGGASTDLSVPTNRRVALFVASVGSWDRNVPDLRRRALGRQLSADSGC